MNKEQQIRKQATSDKWEKYVYSQQISQKYPEVSEIIINLNLNYPNAFAIHKKEYTSSFTPTDKACFDIGCINRECLYSDLCIDNEVHNAIYKKQEVYEGSQVCNGYNTFSAYEHKNGTCLTELKYMIRIKYK